MRKRVKAGYSADWRTWWADSGQIIALGTTPSVAILATVLASVPYLNPGASSSRVGIA